MSGVITPQSVPCFNSVDEFEQGLATKANFGAIDLYPRDGTIQLCKAEAQVAELARVKPNQVILVNSGMAAVKTAIETALHLTAGTHQPVLAYCPKVYSQNKTYIATYIAQRGVRVVEFDSADKTSIENTIIKYKPNVIFSETVGNGGNLPILDSAYLVELAAKQVPKAITILDNTLPLSTGLPVIQNLKEDNRVLVVESGTKSYTFNKELIGLIYTKNTELIQAVRTYRRTTGTMPGIGSVGRIQSLLPTVDDFDKRNRQLFTSTETIALELFKAEQAGGDFTVAHPSLPSHPNHQYAKEHVPHGGTPVLFLIGKGTTDQYVLARRLWESPEVRELADIGQSFGFDRSRILPTEKHNTLRISGGATTDSKQLARALHRAIRNI